MPYRITITEKAESQLRSMTAREQGIIEAGILARLQDRPTTVTKAIKRLRPNPLANFELRMGDYRVLYNVEEANAEVVVLIVGKKVGNKLVVEGEEFHGHESNPTS
jgi:mRNA-degrading endonuclease RelE of RelBE toxin-antitoxin system